MTSDQARHTDAAPAGDGHADCDACCSVMLVYDGGKDDDEKGYDCRDASRRDGDATWLAIRKPGPTDMMMPCRRTQCIEAR